jgi:hypothetical protein
MVLLRAGTPSDQGAGHHGVAARVRDQRLPTGFIVVHQSGGLAVHRRTDDGIVVVWGAHMKEVLERLEKKMDAGFERLELKMDRRFNEVDGRFDEVDGRFDEVDGRFGKVDGRFGEVDGQLQKQGVLLEAVAGEVKMALEGIAGNREVLDTKFAQVLEKMNERIQPVELATRRLASKTTRPR